MNLFRTTRRWRRGGLALALLASSGCCPPGQVCNQAPVTKPKPPEELCAYKLKCRYVPQSKLVVVEGTVFNAKEPFPEVSAKINAGPGSCFLFKGQLDINFTGENLLAAVPLRVDLAKQDHPEASVLSEHADGNCQNPNRVLVSVAVPGEPKVCECSLQWPEQS